MTKVKMSVFVEPGIARAMKMQAVRMGCKGVSECVTKLFKLQTKAMKKRRSEIGREPWKRCAHVCRERGYCCHVDDCKSGQGIG